MYGMDRDAKLERCSQGVYTDQVATVYYGLRARSFGLNNRLHQRV